MRQLGLWTAFLCSTLVAAPAWAVDFHSAVENALLDVESQTQQLEQLRDSISEQRAPLAQEQSHLEAEVAELRKELSSTQGRVESSAQTVERLEREVAGLEAEALALRSVLLEFRRELSRSLTLAEEDHFAQAFQELDAQILKTEGPEAVLALPSVLQWAESWARMRWGIPVLEGECLSPLGVVSPGRFLLVGSETYFLSGDDNWGGLVSNDPETLNPAVAYAVSPRLLKELASGSRVLLPVDPTEGKALELEQERESPWAYLRAGGLILVPILLLGILSLGAALWKWLSFVRMRVRWDADLRAIISLMRAGKEKLARERAVPLGEPAGPVLLTGIDWAGESEERTEEQMLSEVMKRIPRLERGLALLSVTAAVAPLLGLLGTVTGMIHTFNLVTIFGAGKAQLLSSGISEALITTEFGLIVAVPALLAHAFLSRRVRQLIMRLEQLCHEFSSAIHFGERSVLVPGSRQWPDS